MKIYFQFSYSNPYPAQLLKNVVFVGDNIHYGEAFEQNIQEVFMRVKNEVHYIHYADMEPYQNTYGFIQCKLLPFNSFFWLILEI